MKVGGPTISEGAFREEEFTLTDVGSERVFLAILMLQPTLIIEAQRMVEVQALSYELHQYIYQIMIWMAQVAMQNGWPYSFDLPIMLASAQSAGPQMYAAFVAKTDGCQQIQSIAALKDMCRADQFQQYVSIINDRFMRRKIYRTCRDLQKAALDLHANPVAKNLAVQASSVYGRLGFDVRDRDESRLRKLGTYRDEAMVKVDFVREFKYDMLFHVPCYKYRRWMQLLGGGFLRKGLSVLCARPKVGKSTLMLDIATDLAIGETQVDLDGQPLPHTQTPVLYLDTEMSGQEMFFRNLSHVSMVLESDIIAGKLMEDGADWASVQTACARMADAPFYYVNIAGKDMDFVTSVMRQFRNEVVGTQVKVHRRSGKEYVFSRPGAVFYDWMKLPDGNGLKHSQETQLIGFQAQAIKNAAYELDLPVVAGAQLNREAIKATASDWEWNAEAFISASDRLAMFCNVMCVLRNVMPDEVDVLDTVSTEFAKDESGQPVLRKWTEWRPENPFSTDETHRFRFNQKLHQILGRGCGVFRQGIPLYIDRGRARYEEVGDDETWKFVKQKANKPLRHGKVPAAKVEKDAATKQAIT